MKPAALTLLTLLLASCSPLTQMLATPTPTPTPDPKSWVLVWADEFDQPDASAPDSKKWNFQQGGDGWGNAELEYYTDSLKNASIQNGMLAIQAIQEKLGDNDYTSARLTTQNKGDWATGRVEIRAKLPNTQGIWPAFWLMPTSEVYGGWPVSGEIDLMEMIGKEPGRIYGTLHYGNPHTFTSGSIDLPGGAAFSDDFHVFALEWEPTEFRWYLDGKLYYTKNDWFTSHENSPYPAPFDQKFYILINMAVGGRWPGNPDQTSVFPQTMLVDYVRVYQHPK